MFSPLTSQLRAEIETVERVLRINDAVRDLLNVEQGLLAEPPTELSSGANDTEKLIHTLRQMRASFPNKLDWQIYDHCAALTRLYSIYERFVVALVSEYVQLLPELYQAYSELPPAVTTQHRLGIGQILLKMGEKGPYKDLEEQVIVRELATGLSGAAGYKLLANAFFIERQNLRLNLLCQLFSTLDFQNCVQFVTGHPDVRRFLRDERGDSSSAEKELSDLVEFRNEAAHRKVDNVLSIDAIASFGRFIVAFATALADMVEERILHRRVELGQLELLLNVSELHDNGRVVVGILKASTTLVVGEEIAIVTKHSCKKCRIESIQLDGANASEATSTGELEVGLRLSKRASLGAELRTISPPDISIPVQLPLPELGDTREEPADSDVPILEADATGDQQHQEGSE